VSRVLTEPDPASVREILTPEGIPLRFELAGAGDRAAAFFIDMLIWGLAVGLIALLASAFAPTDDAAEPGETNRWVIAVVTLFTFVSRVFYFIWFEARWRGATPGKSRIGIRVMDRNAEPLRVDAIIVRNFMREIEVWVPIALLTQPELLWPDAPPLLGLFSVGWLIVLVLMPLFNRDRLRVGDMVAGTVVVLSPRAALRTDLGGREVERSVKKAAQFTFSKKQLEVYGIYELQVLEELLRRQDPYKREAVHAVCQRIQRRIQWRGDPVRTERFLREFYTAVRAHLEQRMLLGKRKKDKHS